MIVVSAYSHERLNEFPQAGQEAMRQQVNQDQIADLINQINKMIAAPANEINLTFATWDDLIAAAGRLLRVSMLRPITPAERQVMNAWRMVALEGGQPFAKMMNDREKLAMWGNCGRTATLVLERLQANYDAAVELVDTVLCEKGMVNGLNELLKRTPASAQEVYVLEGDFDIAHNFLIEVRHDGVRYLVQGYQSLYPAPWWSTKLVRNPVNGEPVDQEQHEFRAKYGHGQDIRELYDSMMEAIVAVAKQGYQSVIGQRSAWRMLPFYTKDIEAVGAKELPRVRVKLFSVRNAAHVRTVMDGLAGSLCTQATLSLPVPEQPVDQNQVITLLAKLGLTASHSMDNTGVHKFKVNAVAEDAPKEMKDKLVVRVAGRDVRWLRPAHLPDAGSAVPVGYIFRGEEMTVACTVR